MSERTLKASIDILSEIENLVKRGEDVAFVGDPSDFRAKMLNIERSKGGLFFIRDSGFRKGMVGMERPIFVGGALYSETIPLHVNRQIHDLKKLGYDAQVYSSTTFVACGDGLGQLSTLLSDPSIQPIHLDGDYSN